MGGQLNIHARHIKGNSSAATQLDAKKIKNATGKGFQQNGYGGGVNNDVNNPKAAGQTEVKTITPPKVLDDGSSNEIDPKVPNSPIEKKLQKGLMFGKIYTFTVKDYTNGPPQNKKSIKWLIKYHSPTKNQWVEKQLKSTGNVCNLFMNNTDMCGRFIYIKAFIGNKNSGAELKIWKHNRFRLFNRRVVYEQAKLRASEAWRINQGSTSLCGMACIFYLLAKKDGAGYEKLVKELFRTGSYKYNNYTIEPHANALVMYDMDPYRNSKYPNIPQADWLTLGLVRSKESSLSGKLLYKGENGQDKEAIIGLF